MSDTPIVPCIWMDHQAEEAARFYTTLLPGGRVTAVSRYPDTVDNPGGKPRGSVLTVEFEVAGQRMTALNGGPQFQPNPSVSMLLELESVAEVDRVFAALAEGGVVRMPLGEYPWSPRFGWVSDRYGMSWQVMVGGAAGPKVVVTLLFVGAQRGRAAEALALYARVLDGARVEAVEYFGDGACPDRLVKHARLAVGGQTLAMMDAPGEHAFAFNEGVSLQVMCADQGTVDRYWRALSEGGAEGPCGWLKDRFGVSWQVVPAQIGQWLASDDHAARNRAFGAVMGMTKLDLAAIEAAYRGG